jgi:iron complex outermembrane receptor protein
VSADYRIPAKFGAVILHADYNYRSRIFFSAAPPADPLNSQAGYGIANASIAAKLASGVTLTTWARNLADKKYLQRVTNLQGVGFLNGYPGDPRTYGVTASFEF